MAALVLAIIIGGLISSDRLTEAMLDPAIAVVLFGVSELWLLIRARMERHEGDRTAAWDLPLWGVLVALAVGFGVAVLMRR
jgi:hypothetical protein